MGISDSATNPSEEPRNEGQLSAVTAVEKNKMAQPKAQIKDSRKLINATYSIGVVSLENQKRGLV